MEDKARLVKRSQLKRSQYKILGKPLGSCDVSHDAHLRDYEEEIFDDGDFYHQVRKGSSSFYVRKWTKYSSPYHKAYSENVDVT